MTTSDGGFLRWLPRFALMISVLLANYLYFFGTDNLRDYFEPPMQFTAPIGPVGTLTVSVSSTVRPAVDSGVFKISLDGADRGQVLQKWDWKSFVSIDPAGTSFAYCNIQAKEVN